MRKDSAHGFTILELLIVVAMLGVLISLILIRFIGPETTAYDTRRKSDLRQYQNMLEIYASANDSLFPRRSGGGTYAHTTLCRDLGYSSGECPEDPKQGDRGCNRRRCEYRYQTDSCSGGSGTACATQYVLWAALEKEDAYFVLCSDGKAGDTLSGIPPSRGNCPL